MRRTATAGAAAKRSGGLLSDDVVTSRAYKRLHGTPGLLQRGAAPDPKPNTQTVSHEWQGRLPPSATRLVARDIQRHV